MRSTRSISLSIGAAALLVSTPNFARAQASDSLGVAEPSCLASIPDSLLRTVPVYLQAELADSADRPILPGIDLLTQEVADSVRASLGARAGELPNGEPRFTWRTLGARLDVVLHRDGRVQSAIRLDDDVYRSDAAAGFLLAQVLASVASNDQSLVIWPDGLKSDSVAFRLAMHYPFVNGRGDVGTLSLRQGFALFSMRVPTEEPVVPTRVLRPEYAEELWLNGVEGGILVQFIVDTTGRAEMATVKDLWPSDRPRLTGDKAMYYEKFLKAVFRSIALDRFEPARIGGCKVRQLVQMPFAFTLRR